MRVSWSLAVVAAVCACRGETQAPTVVATSAMAHGKALAAVQAARCAACHQPEPAAMPRLLPAPHIPLTLAPAFHAGDALAQYLAHHHGGEDAAMLAAFVRANAPPVEFVAGRVGGGAMARGEQLYAGSGCVACHDAVGVAGLDQRTDHAQLAAFLTASHQRRPDLAHDFGLDAAEAAAIAAWLLRGQQRAAPAAVAGGLRCECFELEIENSDLPDFTGRQPVRTTVVTSIDVAARSRGDHFALRFSGALSVPASGEWTFICGSDDCSWLFVDGELVVRNEDLAPHRRQSGTVRLEAGAHDLQVVYTEAEGGQSLEVLWAGPGQPEAPIPANALSTGTIELAAPVVVEAVAPLAAIARGRQAFAERGCLVCHEFAAAPAPTAAARPWSALVDGRCPTAGSTSGLVAAANTALAAPATPAVELATHLHRHDCTRCHARDGSGGPVAEVRSRFVATEDLGDEGRLPPDLTHAGRRLRVAWLEQLLRGERRARPYLQARMPRLPPDLAATLARLFAAADDRSQDDAEPPFRGAAVTRGRDLAGTSGKNCVSCHPFAGRPALGPQGMDLAQLHERLQPAWFAEWLLHADALRPGTRMPKLWWRGDADDRAEVEALRVWSSLGHDAPVPLGARARDASLVLDPVDRPILHGAFLEGLSARCLAVGSPWRVHYAYDLEHARLGWLWRGAFVDADGTWAGRAGKLLRPLGDDHAVLGALRLRDADARVGADVVRVLGQERDAAGYPAFVLGVGDAVVVDLPLPRFTDSGTEIVRRFTCRTGNVELDLAPGSGGASLSIDGAPAAPRQLRAGESIDVVYRW